MSLFYCINKPPAVLVVAERALAFQNDKKVLLCYNRFGSDARQGKQRRTTDIGKILRELCAWKGVEIIEAHACKDHIHMYVSILQKLSVSSFVGFLKGGRVR